MIRTVAGCVMLVFGCWALADGQPVIVVPHQTEATSPKPADPDADLDAERRELRKRLDELLKRLDAKAKAPEPKKTPTVTVTVEPIRIPAERPTVEPIPVPPKVVEPKVVEPTTEPEVKPKIAEPTISDPKADLPSPVPPKVVEPKAAEPVDADPLASGQRLYKAGDFDGALKAFQSVDVTQAGGDKMFVRYMTGCCLRRAGKLSEAAEAYREVAAAGDDEFLAECAQWQLGSIKWREDTEKQLDRLQQLREAGAERK